MLLFRKECFLRLTGDRKTAVPKRSSGTPFLPWGQLLPFFLAEPGLDFFGVAFFFSSNL